MGHGWRRLENCLKSGQFWRFDDGACAQAAILRQFSDFG
jgi:hypothetical protein